MTQHTPGPWIEFEDRESHDIIAKRDGQHIAEMIYLNSLDPDGERIANARLIAKAPEMLELLTRIANAPYPGHAKTYGREARALLREIKGEK